MRYETFNLHLSWKATERLQAQCSVRYLGHRMWLHNAYVEEWTLAFDFCCCPVTVTNLQNCPTIMLYKGRDWNRLQPREKIKGSLDFRIFLCHLCFFKRTYMGIK